MNKLLFIRQYLGQMQTIITVEWAELVCGNGRDLVRVPLCSNQIAKTQSCAHLRKVISAVISFIHSFIFGNCFFLLRVEVDLEPVLGTLGVMGEHTLILWRKNLKVERLNTHCPIRIQIIQKDKRSN